MNSCGVNIPSILNRFISTEDIHEYEEIFAFSNWYDAMKGNIPTPKSWIFEIDDLFNGEIDRTIKTLGNECFARLDYCSSKPTAPYTCSEDIYHDLNKSDRCKPYMDRQNLKIIVREYLHELSKEIRCFIQNFQFRAISSQIPLTDKQIEDIKELVHRITHYSDYNDYSCDLAFYKGKLILIEINSPVWLFATSGEFDLNDVADRTILLDQYIFEDIDLPIVKYTQN